MKITIDAKNIGNMIEAYRAAPDNTIRNMGRAMFKSMRDIQAEARQNHNFTSRSHSLERSVSIQLVSSAPLVVGRVFLNENEAPHGQFIHTGTGIHGPKGAPFEILPKNRPLLRWVNPQTGRFTSAKRVMNPGVKSDPFLYNAAEVKTEHVNTIFQDAIARSIKEAGLS